MEINNIPELTPLAELTADAIKKLIIHSTISSLRRASVNKVVEVVDDIEGMPKLYYHLEADNTWSIHALSTDLSKYLLLQSIN